jgi:hypothetical protein
LRSLAQSRSGETWQTACRINWIAFAVAVLRYGAVLPLHDKKTPLAAIDGHQIRHQIPCHRQGRAIRISFLLGLVIQLRQCRTQSRSHLGRLLAGMDCNFDADDLLSIRNVLEAGLYDTQQIRPAHVSQIAEVDYSVACQHV